MPAILTPDYAASAHQPLDRVKSIDLAMLATRYAWAAGHAAGKDVAEIACGSGIGAGWLARMARSLVVGDVDPRNCRVAQETYAGWNTIRVRQIDAFDLPFRSSSLDLLVLLEAIYYLRDAESFFEEGRRVLRRGGSLLVSTVNPEWCGFRPSPLATRYFTASELTVSLKESGFSTRIQAGFAERGIVNRVLEKFSARKEKIPRELEPGRNASEKLITVGPEMDLRRYRTLYIQATKAR